MENVEHKYTKAAKRVKELKDFYRHVKIFVAVNATLYLLKSGLLWPYLPEGFPQEPYYYDWIDINLVVWIAILSVHVAYLFRYKFTFLNKWEEQQIQKYMDEEENTTKKYR